MAEVEGTAQVQQDDHLGNVDQGQQGGEEQKPKEARTYTDEEVDAIIERKLARWKKQREQEVAEAAKLAEMNATQKLEYERDQANKKLAEYERERERAAIVAEVAADKGVDADWLSRMAGDGREAIEANADFIAGKLSGARVYPSVSDNGGAKAVPITREQIDAIKDPRERVLMRAQHIDLYKKK